MPCYQSCCCLFYRSDNLTDAYQLLNVALDNEVTAANPAEIEAHIINHIPTHNKSTTSLIINESISVVYQYDATDGYLITITNLDNQDKFQGESGSSFQEACKQLFSKNNDYYNYQHLYLTLNPY